MQLYLIKHRYLLKIHQFAFELKNKFIKTLFYFGFITMIFIVCN